MSEFLAQYKEDGVKQIDDLCGIVQIGGDGQQLLTRRLIVYDGLTVERVIALPDGGVQDLRALGFGYICIIK